jgi:hypothetical protein
MSEICQASYLLFTVPVTVLCMLALEVAKRADQSLQGSNEICPLSECPESVSLTLTE